MFCRKEAPPRPRRGFTMLELCAAVAILIILLPIIAQLACWSLTERLRAQGEEAALKLAQNVLESARAQPWEDLTARWASAQSMPSQTALLLPEGKLTVTIEPEKNATRRVTVSITWQADAVSPRQVQLVTLLSPRSVNGK